MIESKLLKTFFVISFYSISSIMIGQENHDQLRISTEGNLNSPFVSVLAYHNHYPVGMQGGIELIKHDKRIATNGDIHIVPKTKIENKSLAHEPIPKISIPERIIHQKENILEMLFKANGSEPYYQLFIKPTENHSINIQLKINEIFDTSLVKEMYFSLHLYPEYFKGKSIVSNNSFALFPQIFDSRISDEDNQKPLPILTGNEITISQEKMDYMLSFHSENNEIHILDNRLTSDRYWFEVRINVDLTNFDNALNLTINTNIDEEWFRVPMISYSQVGYIPSQKKIVPIELDIRTKILSNAKLVKLNSDGTSETVLNEKISEWGKFYRYKYGMFDFSSVNTEGVYQIQYEETTTAPFKISNNLYKHGVWQPSLGIFIPVQMCHMRVKDKNRLWHGLCHMDDGIQAPPNLEFFDGFDQGKTTETQYSGNEHIPNINIGGWHDAADDDVNVNSNGKATYHLALAYEEFKPNYDQTSIDFNSKEVKLFSPDGVADIIQQIEHGVDFLLAQYKIADHSIIGVISSSWETYLQEGHWEDMTDGLIYNSNFPIDSTDGYHSGVFDDRYVFTSKDTRREYQVIAFLCASSRALEKHNKSKAEECLEIAKKIWNYEENNTPVFFRSVGTPRNLLEQRTNAAVELFLTTKDQQYAKVLVDYKKEILDNINKTAWSVARVIKGIGSKDFYDEFNMKLEEYSSKLNEKLNSNPFGVSQKPQVWGFGWNILWETFTHYYLVKSFPKIFDTQPIEDAVHYTLGRHASNNLSLVSGVGSHRPIPAFGLNRSDYSFIPGGVYSGVNLILPDFPELKSEHPHLWQQTEYIISGATPFIFSVLAIDKLHSK